MVLTPAQRDQMLAGAGLFSGAGRDGRSTVAERLLEAEFPAGHRITRPGEIETGFFDKAVAFALKRDEER
jgi:hypothetical protein